MISVRFVIGARRLRGSGMRLLLATLERSLGMFGAACDETDGTTFYAAIQAAVIKRHSR